MLLCRHSVQDILIHDAIDYDFDNFLANAFHPLGNRVAQLLRNRLNLLRWRVASSFRHSMVIRSCICTEKRSNPDEEW